MYVLYLSPSLLFLAVVWIFDDASEDRMTCLVTAL